MLQSQDSDEMALRLDGKLLARDVERRLKDLIDARLAQAGRPPGLAVLRVGDDPASAVYVANKEKACGRIGVVSYGDHLSGETSPAEVLRTIRELNADQRVDGILLQLPLPGLFLSGSVRGVAAMGWSLTGSEREPMHPPPPGDPAPAAQSQLLRKQSRFLAGGRS